MNAPTVTVTAIAPATPVLRLRWVTPDGTHTDTMAWMAKVRPMQYLQIRGEIRGTGRTPRRGGPDALYVDRLIQVLTGGHTWSLPVEREDETPLIECLRLTYTPDRRYPLRVTWGDPTDAREPHAEFTQAQVDVLIDRLREEQMMYALASSAT